MLSANEIESVKGAFDHNPQLKNVFLENNKIKSIEGGFDRNPQLERIVLRGNPIENVEGAFKYNPQLNILRDNPVEHSMTQTLRDPVSLKDELNALGINANLIKEIKGRQLTSAKCICFGDRHNDEGLNQTIGRLIDVFGKFGDNILVEGGWAHQALSEEETTAVLQEDFGLQNKNRFSLSGWDDLLLMQRQRLAVFVQEKCKMLRYDSTAWGSLCFRNAKIFEEARKLGKETSSSRDRRFLEVVDHYLSVPGRLFVIAGEGHLQEDFCSTSLLRRNSCMCFLTPRPPVVRENKTSNPAFRVSDKDYNSYLVSDVRERDRIPSGGSSAREEMDQELTYLEQILSDVKQNRDISKYFKNMDEKAMTRYRTLQKASGSFSLYEPRVRNETSTSSAMEEKKSFE